MVTSNGPPPNFLLETGKLPAPPPPHPLATAPPNVCSRFSATSLLLPSNFLWCTLHPVPCSTVAAAHPCPLNGGAPPPIFCCQFLALKWQTPCPPPPTPAADFMPSLLSPTTAPPNACSRFSAASLLLPCNFLWCTLHPAAQLQPAHPCPLHGGVPPPPPPKFSAANPRRSSQQIFCCQFPAAQARPCSHPKDKQLKVCHRFGERCGGC